MRKVLVIIIAVFTLLSSSVYADNAIYIYRNDGNFNAFFDSEIDSISYSATDTSGVVHPHHVTQLVHTPDSLYRIPLSAIDSIAFTERPVQYNPEVIKLAESYIPYIISSEGLTITFSSLPDELRIYNGDILLYEGFTDMFPDGFVGRVTNITETGSTINVQCEEVAIEEVYEQLTVISDYVLEESPETPSQYRLKQVSPKAEASLSLKLGINIPAGEIGSFTASYTGSLKVRAIITMSPNKPFYADFSYTAGHSFNGELKLKASKKFFVNGDKSVKLFKASLPLPNCPMLKFEYVVSPFCKGELTGSLSASVDVTSTTTSGVTFREGCEPERYTRSSGGFTPPQLTSAFNISGYVFGGIISSAYFGTVGNFAGAEMNVYVGPKLEGNLNVDFATLAEDGIYEAVKDAKVSFGYAAELEALARMKLMNWETSKVFGKAGFGLVLDKRHLYPLFSVPTYTQGKDKSVAKLSISPVRELLFPVSVGMRLVDDEDNSETRYSQTDYINANLWSGDYEEEFSYIHPERHYTCYPMVKAFGMEMRATPVKHFGIDVVATTGEVSEVTSSTATVGGYGDCLESAESIAEMGIVYSAGGTPSVSTGTFISSGESTSGEFSVKLTGLKAKTMYNYRACVIIDEKEYYGEVNSFTTKEDEITPGQEVDLGLSVKWAGWNVGASSPEEYGGYYAWGETEEKSDYDWDTYKFWQDKDNDGYVGSNEMINIGSNISGTQYDVAHVKWGNGWRMPTKDEIQELYNKCKFEGYTYNGVRGCKVTGPNGNSIFLPGAGYRGATSLGSARDHGYYWSGSLYEGYRSYAWLLDVNDIGNHGVVNNYRRYGHSVRPVRD